MNNQLQVIQKHGQNGDLVFVRPEDLQTQRMFVAEVTVLHATPQDFHNISGKMQPKSYFLDRIAEATGVSFVAAECGVRKEGKSVWVGFAQGKRRLPDGTYRTSERQEYEFDVDVRSKEDFLKDSKGQYNTETAKEKHVLEMKKFARARAATGARLRVIRELVGLPIGLEPNQVQKAIVVSRIAVNTDELLSMPGMKQAAIAQAVGIQQQLFGPGQKNIERQVITEVAGLEKIPESELREPGATQGEPTDDFKDDVPWDEDPRDIIRRGLQHYLDNNQEVYFLPDEPMQVIKAAVENPDILFKALKDVEKRIKDYVARKEMANEKYAAHMQAMREAGRVVE